VKACRIHFHHHNIYCMATLLQAAVDYHGWGYAVLPVDAHKKSLVYWKKYQQQRMSLSEIQRWFQDRRCHGIAVLTGPISGNLEMIDIDSKNDLSGRLIHDFGDRLRQQYPHILDSLVIAATRNAGYHFFYKSVQVGRNTVLARRPATIVEQQTDPFVRVKVLLETRGTGGYGIVEPTMGYRFLRGSLQTVRAIPADDREALHRLARSFNTLPEPVPTQRQIIRVARGPESPLDDFDARGDLRGLLTSYGWVYVRTRANRSYYRRPGETDHDTSGDYHHGLGLFAVFSTSTEFTPYQPYRPSAVYAILACGGDFHLAAKQLVEAGFGIPYSQIGW
jgi:putative DNA primase/helicase